MKKPFIEIPAEMQSKMFIPRTIVLPQKLRNKKDKLVDVHFGTRIVFDEFGNHQKTHEEIDHSNVQVDISHDFASFLTDTNQLNSFWEDCHEILNKYVSEMSTTFLLERIKYEICLMFV